MADVIHFLPSFCDDSEERKKLSSHNLKKKEKKCFEKRNGIRNCESLTDNINNNNIWS